MSFQPDLRRVVSHTWQATQFPSHDAGRWHELAAALAAIGDRAGACAALRHALLIDPRGARTLRELGNLLFDCGQLEAALECFDRFARLRAVR